MMTRQAESAVELTDQYGTCFRVNFFGENPAAIQRWYRTSLTAAGHWSVVWSYARSKALTPRLRAVIAQARRMRQEARQ